MTLKTVVSSFCLPKCCFCDQSGCKIFPTVKVYVWKCNKKDIRLMQILMAADLLSADLLLFRFCFFFVCFDTVFLKKLCKNC